MKEFYRMYFLRSTWFYTACHTLPRAENRVDTDPEVKDGRGVPVSFTYRLHTSTGRCRMGRDPKSSVTDASGRVHDVPNVVIADGSLLVNPGGSNPSLTIQALAYRVASKILRS
jgi:choline dehydrogenase-like flavoprotein